MIRLSNRGEAMEFRVGEATGRFYRATRLTTMGTTSSLAEQRWLSVELGGKPPARTARLAAFHRIRLHRRALNVEQARQRRSGLVASTTT